MPFTLHMLRQAADATDLTDPVPKVRRHKPALSSLRSPKGTSNGKGSACNLVKVVSTTLLASGQCSYNIALLDLKLTLRIGPLVFSPFYPPSVYVLSQLPGDRTGENRPGEPRPNHFVYIFVSTVKIPVSTVEIPVSSLVGTLPMIQHFCEHFRGRFRGSNLAFICPLLCVSLSKPAMQIHSQR